MCAVRDFQCLFTVWDSVGLALLLSGGLLLLHHHNGSCYHIYQLDTTHTYTLTLLLHTIPHPPPPYISPLHISPAAFLHLITLWEGERVNDSFYPSPPLCDTPFVVLIRAHNGASGVCAQLILCMCGCVYVHVQEETGLSLTWTCGWLFVCIADDPLCVIKTVVCTNSQVFSSVTCHMQWRKKVGLGLLPKKWMLLLQESLSGVTFAQHICDPTCFKAALKHLNGYCSQQVKLRDKKHQSKVQTWEFGLLLVVH